MYTASRVLRGSEHAVTSAPDIHIASLLSTTMTDAEPSKQRLLDKLTRYKAARTAPPNPNSDAVADKGVINTSEYVIDGLRIALELAAQAAKIARAVPFLEPASILLTEILKLYEEIKDMNEKWDVLAGHIADLTGDICAPLLRVEATDSESELIQRLKADLQKYATLIEKASGLVLKYDDHRKIVRWAAHKQLGGEVDKLNQELNSFGARLRTNRLVDLALNQDIITRTLDEVHCMTAAVHHITVNEELEKWLLSPPDMRPKQHDTEALRMEGTGLWLFEDAKFIEWEDNPGILWIEAPSGAGKSVLASTVIKHLFDGQEGISELQPPPPPVAFFYFDFRYQDRQSLEIALRRLILQLSAYSSQPFELISNHYKLSKGQKLPSYDDLVKILGQLLHQLGHTYLVLDALDECDDNYFPKLIKLVSALHTWAAETPVHVFITSQPRQIFTDAFTDMACIPLEYNTTQEDIRFFIHNELWSNPKLKVWRAQVDDIVDRVAKKSNGMFRLAACLLIELSHCDYPDELEETLQNLPDELFSVYDRFIQKNKKKWLYMEAILCWIMFSKQQVTLMQLADAISFDFSDPVQFKYIPDRWDSNAEAIFNWLEGLVIRSETWDHKPTITLAHASVQDYLLSGPKLGSNPSEGHSHMFIARTCLSYLLYFSKHRFTNTIYSQWSHYPLAQYAATQWPYHLSRSHAPHLLSELVTCLLQEGSEQYKTFRDLLEQFSGLNSPDSPLHLYCRTGYFEGVQILLNNGADPNVFENALSQNHALGIASYYGKMKIVALLLEKGVDVNLPSPRYGSALGSAAFGNEVEIVHFLLKKGADVNLPGGWFGSPLGAASRPGNVEIARLLLDKGANINLPGGNYGSPLGAASISGNVETIHFLLENGADIKTHGSSALKAARGNFWDKKKKREVIALLKDKGAVESDEECVIH
ncbi:hypothetical protein C8F04DRAFT_1308792 [Mycena alexandri]|uniref:Nephrocystin 3-like N-terminal domain-containing protein n=1 Tax=Mycena alexandri TaxID=1745969 RepID=A0AAD6TNH2_9AGAR|nr:hypothetical protein C8F04DRAFT_1308792 [Mycena alexandri]